MSDKYNTDLTDYRAKVLAECDRENCCNPDAHDDDPVTLPTAPGSVIEASKVDPNGSKGMTTLWMRSHVGTWVTAAGASATPDLISVRRVLFDAGRGSGTVYDRLAVLAYGPPDLAVTADSPLPHATYIDQSRLRALLKEVQQP
jgi:hypothetical protein